MGAEAQVKSGWNAIKSHWLAFLVAGFVLVVIAFAYDTKKNGSLRSTIAGLPLVGKLFA